MGEHVTNGGDELVAPRPTADVDIIAFQAGREAAILGSKRDARRSHDWLAGFDQVAGEEE